MFTTLSQTLPTDLEIKAAIDVHILILLTIRQKRGRGNINGVKMLKLNFSLTGAMTVVD